MVLSSEHHSLSHWYHLPKHVNCNDKCWPNLWLLLKCSQATLPFKSWKHYVDQPWNNGFQTRNIARVGEDICHNSSQYQTLMLYWDQKSNHNLQIWLHTPKVPSQITRLTFFYFFHSNRCAEEVESLDDHFFHPFGMLTIFPGNPIGGLSGESLIQITYSLNRMSYISGLSLLYLPMNVEVFFLFPNSMATLCFPSWFSTHLTFFCNVAIFQG